MIICLHKVNHQQTLEETVKVDCPVLSPKDDGSTITRSLPMFLPHQILQHLVKVGLKFPEEWVRNYWRHLKSVGNAWAARVSDETLIPTLGSVSSTCKFWAPVFGIQYFKSLLIIIAGLVSVSKGGSCLNSKVCINFTFRVDKLNARKFRLMT